MSRPYNERELVRVCRDGGEEEPAYMLRAGQMITATEYDHTLRRIIVSVREPRFGALGRWLLRWTS